MKKDYFVTVRTEGAILPPDLLQSITGGDDQLAGLSPGDYHLARGERLNEQINRSWNRLIGIWSGFRSGMDAPEAGAQGTSLTRERWLLHLFQELGYGRLIAARSSHEIGGKSYPISHFWQRVPIHLLGFRVKLDRRTPGVSGAAQANPHSMLQEYLNRTPEALWGFLSNGLQLRILRDNVSLVRPAYIEFDLQTMMEGEVYSDFVLLWLLCHQSRVEAEKAQDSWLEKWYNSARERGSRALDQLRDGVSDAISALGRGFLAHPANRELRSRLRSGTLDKQDYYRQLLRLVYRFIFLFVAEDRELLLLPDAPAANKDRYLQYYSMRRLRTLAGKKRGTKHPDLFRAASVIMDKLYEGEPALALPALGSFLWSSSAVADLAGCDIANEHFLQAVRCLAFNIRSGVRLPVDYRNLGTEELGSVYESLLELHPQLNLDAAEFHLEMASGNERKTTGSYYTHPSLIKCLLDSALDPVLDEVCKKEDPEMALLNLKICDPACGSGHFLIAAAHRVAKRLAAVRTGDDEPSLEDQRRALREVISRSIYGVDINEMAIELCKVSLWMEALEPGKPLSFLDHHLKCGNSLLGTTPALLTGGIPDAAFTSIEGDDRQLCRDLKRQNKLERKHPGQLSLFKKREWQWVAAEHIAEYHGDGSIVDDTLEQVRRKEKDYQEFIQSGEYRQSRLVADTWCAAFVWEKNKKLPGAITDHVFRSIQESPSSIEDWMREEIRRLAEQYRFFHWHLAFPDVFYQCCAEEIPAHEHVGWCGGFDVVLGNPPWERVKLQVKEWFALPRPDIAAAPNAAARRRMIRRLKEEDPHLFRAFLSDRRIAEGESHLLRNTGCYPLCGRGDINTYAVFAELKRQIMGDAGRVGCIVPSGIATDDTTKLFFQSLMDTGQLISLYDFENREGLFPGVHRSYKFCLLTLGGKHVVDKPMAEFLFFATNTGHLLEGERKFTLSAEDVALLNPNTKTCPTFRTSRDAELTKAIYRRVSVFIRDGELEGNPWGAQLSTMFHMSNDSHLFRTRNDLEKLGWVLKGNIFEKDNEQYLPLYEAKMFHHFDHRFGSYETVSEDSVSTNLPATRPEQYADPEYAVLPRYWVHEEKVLPKIADAPDAVIRAYELKMEDVANKSLYYWLNGYKINRGEDVKRRCNLHIPKHDSITEVPAARSMEEKHPLTPNDFKIIEDSLTGLEMVERILKCRKKKWLLVFRGITNTTNERTIISSVIPGTACGNSSPVISSITCNSEKICLLNANLSSFVFDYVARLKVGGTNLNFFIMKQLPLLVPDDYKKPNLWGLETNIRSWVHDRVVELTYIAADLAPFAQELGHDGPPFYWNEERRFLIRCELDAAYFHLYGIERDDVDYIMETFPIVRRKDEAQHGTYHTKETILKIYDQMKLAMETGQPYQTPLNPPPGPPEKWPPDPGEPWSSHIHRPKNWAK